VEPDPKSVPDILRKPARDLPRDEADVGAFRQGSPFSQLALGRYLIGRALAESVGNALLIVAVVVLALAAVSEWLFNSTVLAVLLVIIMAGVLLLRWVLLTLVRRLTGFRQFEPIEQRMAALIGDTRSDVLRELRRLGLPGRVYTLPLLGVRLLRRNRRADTLARLRGFETERAVPRARVDELHLLLRQAVTGGTVPGGPVER
jgi:hypothetical protein